MFQKEQIRALLCAEGIDFDWHEHAAVYTMEGITQAGLGEVGTVCKNLFVHDGKGRHFLVATQPDQRVDLKALAARLGCKKLSFASAERLQRCLGVHQGCVSPLGALNDPTVTVVFDPSLWDADRLGVHPNDNTATVFLHPSDLRRLLEKHGVSLLSVPI